MQITAISDLHGHYPKLEGGDLLIVAGDCANDTLSQVKRFKDWIIENGKLYKKIVLIAGNHDNWMQKGLFFNRDVQSWENDKCWYLEDSGTEFEWEEDDIEREESGLHPSIERKLKIWGSPWTLRFKGMNPHCMAFTCETEEELAAKWALIPDDIDILVTHFPPRFIFDLIGQHSVHGKNPSDKYYVGSNFLRNEVLKRLHLKVHIFGHIHECGGKEMKTLTHFVNASHVNERYEPVNKPIRITL